MHREPIGTLNSLVVKGWFKNENERKNLIWPFRIFNGCYIPFWVGAGYEKEWSQLGEIDRCAYYYLRVTESKENIKNLYTINYDDLVRNPNETIENIADDLNLEFGAKTQTLIDTVKYSEKERAGAWRAI